MITCTHELCGGGFWGTRKHLLTATLAAVALGGLLCCPAAEAVVVTWSATPVSSSWETAANWVGGIVPGGSVNTNQDTATFSGLSSNTTVTPDLNRYIKNIVLGGATGYTIGATSGNALHLDDAGSITSSSSVNQAINTPILLEGTTYTVTNNQSANNLTLGGTIDATLGATTLTFNGISANTKVTGAIGNGAGGMSVNVAGGGVALSGANGYTGSTSFSNQGAIVLDTTTNNTILSSSSSLIAGGGSIQLKGKLSTAISQTFNSLTVNAGASTIDAALNGGASTTIDLRGTGGTTSVTRNAGGVVDFKGTGGTLGTTSLIKVRNANDTSSGGGIIGPWATVNGGADWAKNDGSDNVVAYSGYTTGDLGAIGSDATLNVKLSGTQTTVAASKTFNSLNTTGTLAVTIANGQTLTLAGGGLIGNSTGNVGSSGTTGCLTGSASGELIVNAPASFYLYAVIVNNGGPTAVIKTGAGAVYFSANNSYSGGTYIEAGTVRVAHAHAFGTGPITITGGTLSSNGAIASLTYNNLQNWNGDFSVDGYGVNMGTGTVTLGGNRTVTVVGLNDSTRSFTVGGIITGAYGLTKAGLGPMILTGASGAAGYTGPTAVQNGTLILSGGNDRLPTTTAVTLGVTSGTNTYSGLLQLGDTTAARDQTLAGLATSGTGTTNRVVGGHATNISTLTLNIGSGTNTYGGYLGGPAINQNNLALTKSGAGTLALTTANTYVGATTVNGGTLQTAHNLALGIGVASANVTTVTAGTLDLNGMAPTGEKIILNGTGISSSGALINNSGTAASAGGGVFATAISNGGSGYTAPPTVSFAGDSSGAAATALMGVQGLNFTAGGTGYTWATVTISGGGGSGATATATVAGGQVTSVTLATAGTGYTSKPTVTIAGPAGSSGATNNASAAGLKLVDLLFTNQGANFTSTPTINFTGDGSGAAVSSDYATINLATNSSVGGSGNMTLGGGITGTGSAGLTKVGSGSVTLNAPATYTGDTTVSVGKLYVNSSLPTSAVSVANLATLGGTGTVSGTATVAGGGSIEAGNGTSGKLTLGGLAFSGTGSINFGTLDNYASDYGVSVTGLNALTASGSTVFIHVNSLGTAIVGNDYKLIGYNGGTGIGSIQLAPLPNRGAGTLVKTGTEIKLHYTGADFVRWIDGVDTKWDTATNNWELGSDTSHTPTKYIDSPGDAVVFDDNATPFNPTVSLDTADVHPTTVTFNNSKPYTLQSSGVFGIAGPTGLTLNGTGKVSVLNANSFTGPVAVNAGSVLNIQNNAALGSSSGVTVASGATLQLEGGITIGAIPLTLSGAGVSSQGALLSKSGGNSYAGQLTLGANATITADVTDAGVLALTNTSAITGSGYTLTLDGGSNGTLAGGLATNAGGLTKTGMGTWTLSGANTYTGPTLVQQGTLTYGALGAIATGSAVTVDASIFPAVWDIQTYSPTVGTVTLRGELSEIKGTGTLTSSGNFELESGTVRPLLAGATASLNKSTAGTVTILSKGTYGGPTAIKAGKLVLGGTAVWDTNGILPAGTTVTLGDTTTTGKLVLGNAAGARHQPLAGLLTTGLGGSVVGGSTSVSNLSLTIPAGPGPGPDATFDGMIGGPDNNENKLTFIKAGVGTLELTGANTYTGGTYINQGTLRVSSIGNTSSHPASNMGSPTDGTNGAIGMGDGATAAKLLYIGNGETTDRPIKVYGISLSSNTIDQSGHGSLVFNYDHIIYTNNTPTTLTLQGSTDGTGTMQMTLADSDATHKLNVIKAGTGTWTLNGNHTYTGGTAVTDGTLVAANVSNLTSATGGGTVTIGNSTTPSLTPTLAGAGFISGIVTVNGPGSGSAGHVAPGAIVSGASAVGTLTVGGLTLNGGSVLDLNGDLFSGGLDLINVTGADALILAASGSTTVNVADLSGSLTAGPHHFIKYQGTAFTDINGKFSGGAVPTGFTGMFFGLGSDTFGNYIDLTLLTGGGISTWSNAAGGSWNVGGNWSGGAPNAPGAAAELGIAVSAPVTVDTAVIAGSIKFTTANAYTVNGPASITMQSTAGNALIEVQQSVTQTIKAPLIIASSTDINGPGSLIAGNISTDSGQTLNINTSVAADAISGVGNTSVAGGKSLTADSIVQGTLSIGAGATVTIRETTGGAVNAVPEPCTWVLIGTALIGWLAFRRRRG